jgi:hypothetical protein
MVSSFHSLFGLRYLEELWIRIRRIRINCPLRPGSINFELNIRIWILTRYLQDSKTKNSIIQYFKIYNVYYVFDNVFSFIGYNPYNVQVGFGIRTDP